MTAVGVVRRALAAPPAVVCLMLCSTVSALADPNSAEAPCRQFAAVLQVSSVNYNGFAYSIAGNGAHVDYQDPTVRGDNINGRTALRKSAAAALAAASTPGLTPAIANPMRSWSWHAVKLAVAMGLRADGNTLNDAATELNKAADITQLACAEAGIRAEQVGHR